MSSILELLHLDHTVFIQFGIFAVLFFLLPNIFFRPYLKLFEQRHKKMVEDREAADRMMKQANDKFEEYKRKIGEERAAARKDYEQMILAAKKDEFEILNSARNEAKKLTQEAIESVNAQRDQLKKQIDADVETFGKQISEKLMTK